MRSRRIIKRLDSSPKRCHPLKIGFLSYANIDSAAGIEYWLKDMILRLNSRNQISVLTMNAGTRRLNIKGFLRNRGITVDEIRVCIPGSSIPTPMGFVSLQRFIKAQDVVFFLYCPGGLEMATTLLQRTLHVPIIAGHTFPIKLYRETGNLRLIRRAYSIVLGDAGMKIGKHLAFHQAENVDLVNELHNLNLNQVFMLAAGVDARIYHPSKKSTTFTVLFLGRLELTKGVDLLPDLYFNLRNRLPDFKFSLVGEGSLSSVAKNLAVFPNVEWFGFASDEQKRSLLSKAHVLIAPSRAEALMHTGLEAMASGTPVIASDISGVREYIRDGENGFLVKSKAEMVEKVLVVYEKWKAVTPYEEMSHNAEATAANFDYDRVAPKFEAMFFSVVKKYREKCSRSRGQC